MRISALKEHVLALRVVCLAERNLFRQRWNTCDMKHTYASFGTKIYFVRVFFTKWDCLLTMRDRTIWICHSIQLAILQSLTSALKQASIEVLLNNVVEILRSEVAWLIVKHPFPVKMGHYDWKNRKNGILSDEVLTVLIKIPYITGITNKKN